MRLAGLEPAAYRSGICRSDPAELQARRPVWYHAGLPSRRSPIAQASGLREPLKSPRVSNQKTPSARRRKPDRRVAVACCACGEPTSMKVEPEALEEIEILHLCAACLQRPDA